VIKPMPGGDTCYAEPFELTGVRRGDEVVFTNQTTGKVVITFDLGLSGPATIEIGSNSSKSVPVGSQVEENRKYFYSLSCAPSVVGDARPRIVIRASSEG